MCCVCIVVVRTEEGENGLKWMDVRAAAHGEREREDEGTMQEAQDGSGDTSFQHSATRGRIRPFVYPRSSIGRERDEFNCRM